MPFSLLVRRSPEGDSVEVTVKADDTVESVARLAAASFSKEDGAAVCFRGQVLRPEVTLASAGVTAAHFVVLCFPKRGRPQGQPSLRRVCSGKGWVVHGLLLEYSDGVRTGFFGENDGSPVPLSDDAALVRRGGVWQDVPPGEELVSISGRNSTMGYLCAALTRNPNPKPKPKPKPKPNPNPDPKPKPKPTPSSSSDPNPRCGALSLRLSSGRVIECKGENAGVFGAPFTHHAAPSPGRHHELTLTNPSPSPSPDPNPSQVGTTSPPLKTVGAPACGLSPGRPSP